MKYDQLVQEIDKLIGLKLNSIKPGAEITISQIDTIENRIIIKTASGQKKSRPLGEIEKIWECLCSNPAVHVEEVLGGSGSSRNQPETILANLPFIEWARINRKKHLILVSKLTHPYGTLKQMDPIKVEELRNKIEAQDEKPRSIALIISEDIRKDTNIIEVMTGKKAEPLAPGIYGYNFSSKRVLFVTDNLLEPSIPCGTYLILETKLIPPNANQVRIAGEVIYAVSKSGKYILLRQN